MPGDVVLRAGIAQRRLQEARPFVAVCALQVSAEKLSQDAASKLADDICWLLQLALGQKVAWVELGRREDTAYTLLQRRSVNAPSRVSKNRPLYNYGDEVLKRYLDTAYPIYVKDESWWRVTLDWFAIAYENSVVEVTGLVFSMLLERITKFLLKTQNFPKQIDDSLDEKLNVEIGAKEGALLVALDQAFGTVTSKWSRDRSVALLGTIKEWNQGPSYAAKIKTLFEQFGLCSPSGKFLKNRSSLAHEGELKSNTDPSEYHQQITNLVTSLLLKTAGYSGRYFVLGLGERQL